MWTKEVLRASLPEGVLVTDGDRREDDGVVVVDFDVDGDRPRQEVHHTSDDLHAEQHTATEKDQKPNESEIMNKDRIKSKSEIVPETAQDIADLYLPC